MTGKIGVIVKRNGFDKPKKKIVFDPGKVSWERFVKTAVKKTNTPYFGEIYDEAGAIIEDIDELCDGDTVYVGSCGTFHAERSTLDYRKCVFYHKKKGDCYRVIDCSEFENISKIKLMDMIKKELKIPRAVIDVFSEDGKKIHTIDDDAIIVPPINLKLVIEEANGNSLAAQDVISSFLDTNSEFESSGGVRSPDPPFGAIEGEYDTLSVHSATSSTFFHEKRSGSVRTRSNSVLSWLSDVSCSGVPWEENASEPFSWYSYAESLKEKRVIPEDDCSSLLNRILEDTKGRQFLFEYAKKLEAFQHVEFMLLHNVFSKEASSEILKTLYEFVVNELDVQSSTRALLECRIGELSGNVGEAPRDTFDGVLHHELDFFRRTILPNFWNSSYYQSVRVMLSACVPFKDKKEFNTPLHVAVRENNEKDFVSLIVSKFPPNIGNSFGDSPLHYAVRFGRLPMLNILIDSGANTDIKNASGNTPLHVAAKCATNKLGRQILVVLLEGCADVNILNNDGKPPLLLSPNKKVSLMISKTLSQEMQAKLQDKYQSHEEFVKWEPSISVSVEFFDNEHIQIINSANLLFSTINAKRKQEEVAEVFEMFIPIAISHMSHEETALTHVDYPMLKNHVKAHKQVKRDLLKVQKDMRLGKDVGYKALEVIKSWILNHMLMEDTQYADYLKNVDVEAVCT